MSKSRSKKSFKTKVHDFLENPKGFWGHTVEGFIIILIILSVILTWIQFFNQPLFTHYQTKISAANNFILLVFTVEYIFKFWTAPNKLKFAFKPMSIIDFLAIAPNYLEFILPVVANTKAFRAIRLLRLLRMSRILRLLRFIRILMLWRYIK